jgi:hypothetical protein
MTAASAPNIDGMLLLEAPFARVPHDELRRQLRSQQRLVEREITFCSSSLTSIAHPESVAENGNGNGNGVGTSQHPSGMGDTSFAGDTSFMSEGARADESIMTGIEGDDEGEIEDLASSSKAKSSDLEKSLDVMLGRLKGLKRKVSWDKDY